jgi:hypothetical protein
LLFSLQRLRIFLTYATACICAGLRKGLRKPLRAGKSVVKHFFLHLQPKNRKQPEIFQAFY